MEIIHNLLMFLLHLEGKPYGLLLIKSIAFNSKPPCLKKRDYI